MKVFHLGGNEKKNSEKDYLENKATKKLKWQRET